MGTISKTYWDAFHDSGSDENAVWFQENPSTSFQFIENWSKGSDAKIIDVGGGNSRLIDHLMNHGYTNLTMLDISGSNILKTREELGEDRSVLISWIIADVLNFQPELLYDIWHDRSVFQFLTDESEIDKYVSQVLKSVASGGYLIVSTCSDTGPQKCCDIEVLRYNKDLLQDTFGDEFLLVESFIEGHETPFYDYQEVYYGVLKRM